MGRALRITYSGAHYHVTSRGNEQKHEHRKGQTYAFDKTGGSAEKSVKSGGVGRLLVSSAALKRLKGMKDNSLQSVSHSGTFPA